MKTWRTTRYGSCVALLMALLCGNLQGQPTGPSFFDDFSDGNMTDGSPVNWIFGEDTAGGTEGYTAADLDGAYYIYRDVSISVQIKRVSDYTNNQWVSGFVCRWLDGPTGGYWIEVRPPNRFLFGHRNRWILKSATLPFNVDERELIIRVDAVGDQLKAWCWPADEPMPGQPQISLVDNVAPEGTVGFYYSPRGGEAIYRWVKVESLEVPIVDFNGDGTVNLQDLLKMIGCWGQNEPSVDLVRDGTIDDKDLEVLMGYWQQDVNDPTLMAHWALDETEGLVAADSTGTHDATLIGNPLWQPTGGQIGGALLLDGSPCSVMTPFVCNPAAGPFSAFAWVKGGGPGQVILAQTKGACWLKAADLQEIVKTTSLQGALMTEVKGARGAPLFSPTIITDGAWHRVGLVWDGRDRILYLDGVEVARDRQTALAPSAGGLQIGAGSTLAPGTFWTGLIDDVRLYNRAVQP